MTPPTQLFNTKWQLALFHLAWRLMFPCYWFTVKLVSLFILTREEHEHRYEEPCYERYCLLSVAVPLLFAMIIITSPLLLIGALMWMSLQPYRHRLRYCTTLGNNTSNITDSSVKFTFITANLCLMPECFSRLNNLSNVQHRADAIGRILNKGKKSIESIDDTALCFPLQQTHSTPLDGASEPLLGRQGDALLDVELGHGPSVAKEPGIIVASFPDTVDFICLQEVFERRAMNKLVSHLYASFPHVIYDVGKYTWQSNRFMLNSGLVIASRYQVEQARFRYFSDSAGEELLCSKGVLMVKLLIQRHKEGGGSYVGYLATIHLQAGTSYTSQSGSQAALIRQKQLQETSEYIRDFRKKFELKTDEVLFDVITGDFNFDTSSPGDGNNTKSELFNDYVDHCRSNDGVGDCDWSIGTELVQHRMHKVDKPDSLLNALKNASQLKEYVEGTSENPNPNGKYVEGTSVKENGKRRLDYILYKEGQGQIGCSVNKFNFVTALASLTDHIPIAVELQCSKK